MHVVIDPSPCTKESSLAMPLEDERQVLEARWLWFGAFAGVL